MELKQLLNDINSSRKTLWILCGLPYSGKTYLSNSIIKNTPIVYISIDQILKGLGFDWDSGHLPDESGWKKVFDISYEKSKEALKNNLNVLYDSTNHSKISRDKLRALAQEVKANTRVVFVDIPVELIWKRWEKNNIQKTRSVVSRKLVEETIKSFEAPGDDEIFLRIQNA